MIIDVKFQEQDKRVEATLAQNESAVNTNFGEFQKVPATANHNDLTGREYENQHPISAISGLQEELDSKQPKDNYLKQTDLQKAVDDALYQAKASGEFDGADGADGKDGENGKDGTNGKDGISVTHRWSGTTLIITSASGQSSANLKGEKGDKGDTGTSGSDGVDGFSPIVSLSKSGKVTTLEITDKNGTKKAEILDGKDGEGGGGGVTSWNDLTDKPFGTEMAEGIITFDGDYTKYEYIDVGDSMYVHVSDKVLTVDEVTGATIRVVEPSTGKFEDITADNLMSLDEMAAQTGVNVYGCAITLVSSIENGAQGIFSIGGDISALQALGLPFTKEGTYFVFSSSGNNDFYVESISCLTGLVETVKPIDEKYLPDTAVLEEELYEVIIDELYNYDRGIKYEIPQVAYDGLKGVITWDDIGNTLVEIPVLYTEDVTVGNSSFTRVSMETSIKFEFGKTYKIYVGNLSTRAISTSTDKLDNFSNPLFTHCRKMFDALAISFDKVVELESYAVRIVKLGTEVKPIDEKYIPDTIARTEDILTEEDVSTLINEALGVIENGTY